MEQNNKRESCQSCGGDWGTRHANSCPDGEDGAAPAVDAAELGKLKALAEAARDWVSPEAWDEDRGYSDYEVAGLAFNAAANPAAILRIAALVAQQAARIAELEARFSGAVLMAYVATDLDGHYEVGTTIEQAKQRAGEGCDTIFPLHDISTAFIELEGKPVQEGK